MHTRTHTHTLHPPIFRCLRLRTTRILSCMEVCPNPNYQEPDLRSGLSNVESSLSGYLSRDTPIHSFIAWLSCIYQSGIICLQERKTHSN